MKYIYIYRMMNITHKYIIKYRVSINKQQTKREKKKKNFILINSNNGDVLYYIVFFLKLGARAKQIYLFIC